ncbi:MAG: WD40 repeat domain-containing protein, partial [Caldilineaceae bacterium]|nr:WD40 repeat domain-containing protein [Caldilineaceae bacterium]
DVQAVALPAGKNVRGTSLQGFATWPPVQLYQEALVTTRLTHLAAGGAYIAAAGVDEHPGTQAMPVIWLWHTDPWRFAGVLSGHGMPITAMAITAGGTTLASAADDGTLRLWPVAGGPPRLWRRANPLPVTALAFSPDGSLLAVGYGDGSIEVRAVADGAILAQAPLTGAEPGRLAFVPGPEPRLAVIVDNAVQLWAVEDNAVRPLATLPAESGTNTERRIADVVVSTHGAWLATVGERVQFLDAATGGLLHTLAPPAGRGGYFVQAALSPDGLYLALLDTNGLLQLWAIPAA